MAQPTCLGLPAARWPDHTWNPGDELSAVRLKVTSGPTWLPPRQGQLAPGSELPTASSALTVYLHVDVDKKRKIEKALFSLQTCVNSQLQVFPQNSIAALSQLFQIIPLDDFTMPSQTVCFRLKLDACTVITWKVIVLSSSFLMQVNHPWAATAALCWLLLSTMSS